MARARSNKRSKGLLRSGSWIAALRIPTGHSCLIFEHIREQDDPGRRKIPTHHDCLRGSSLLICRNTAVLYLIVWGELDRCSDHATESGVGDGYRFSFHEAWG